MIYLLLQCLWTGLVFCLHLSITFDDKISQNERWKYEKFAFIHEFFEKVNKNNASIRYPSSSLAMNETLYLYRGRIGIKQYNPSKAAKYELLYRSLCDYTITYSYFTLPHAGKPKYVGSKEASKFYIIGTDEHTKYLVT